MPKNTMNPIATSLRILMSKFDLSRKDISDVTGRNVRTISWWRSGKTQPSTMDLQKISKSVDMTIDDFLELGNRLKID